MSLKPPLFCLYFVALSLFGSQAAAEEINIYFKTAPMMALLRPNSDAVSLSLLVTDAGGRPVERGTLAVRLDAPKSGKWFSTDVPMIEGTVLNRMNLPLRQGRVNWKYIFPIRGEYNLTVEFDNGAGKKAGKSFQFTIRENPAKWFALGGFSLSLLIGGFAAGKIFTKGRGSAAALAIVIIIFTLGTSDEVRAQAVPDGFGTPRLEIERAIVGKPTRLHWSLQTTGAKPTVALTLTITQLEENQVVFAIQRLLVPGDFAMDFHFADGSQHRVSAVAEVQGIAPIETDQVVNVTAVEPPMRAMIPALSYFVVLIAVGLALGRWSKAH